jgi:hypothetical protein
MTAQCSAYDDTAAAERAVNDLLASGVPEDRVQVIMGAELHDVRRESGGAFARSVDPDDEVADFAGGEHARSTPRSSFAGPDAVPGEGTFGNVDRDIVVTYHDGEERERVAGHHQLKRLLMDAGLDDATAEADVHAVHEGRVLVLQTDS